MPKSHVHKYQLRKLGDNKDSKKVYACALEDCSHYQHSKEMIVGKKSICWQCGDEMIITKDITRASIVKPRCLVCKGKIKRVEDQPLDRAVEMLMALRGK